MSSDNEPPAPTGAACPQPELCSLDAVKPGVSVRIKQLNGSAELTSRLREMGFCTNDKESDKEFFEAEARDRAEEEARYQEADRMDAVLAELLAPLTEAEQFELDMK